MGKREVNREEGIGRKGRREKWEGKGNRRKERG